MKVELTEKEIDTIIRFLGSYSTQNLDTKFVESAKAKLNKALETSDYEKPVFLNEDEN